MFQRWAKQNRSRVAASTDLFSFNESFQGATNVGRTEYGNGHPVATRRLGLNLDCTGSGTTHPAFCILRFLTTLFFTTLCFTDFSPHYRFTSTSDEYKATKPVKGPVQSGLVTALGTGPPVVTIFGLWQSRFLRTKLKSPVPIGWSEPEVRNLFHLHKSFYHRK